MAMSLIFPGQGSQSVGMGKEFAEQFAVAREVFAEVDEALSEKLSALIFDGPKEDLGLTRNTQPALMAMSIAALRVLETEAGLDWNKIAAVAGHSLGEYSALCAAGALSLADTAKLLRLRGDAMQAAVPVGQGGMAAILGLDLADVEKAVSLAEGDGVCDVANDNSPGQVVISGSADKVTSVIAKAKELGAKRGLPLPVSAPFHSALMAPAADKMRVALDAATIEAPRVKLVANVTAGFTQSPDEIRDLLVAQVTGRVRWTQSVQFMASQNITSFVEVGAGSVLCGLVKRISPEAETLAFGNPSALADAAALFKS